MVSNPPRAMIRRALFLATAAAVLSGVGVASGAIPGGAQVIDGCYANKTGSLRVIDTEATSPQTCKTSETALSWNQRGLKGETGETGPAGPQGEPSVSSAQELYFEAAEGSVPDGPASNLLTKGLAAGSYLIETQVSIHDADQGGTRCWIAWDEQRVGAPITHWPGEGTLSLRVAVTGAAGSANVRCERTGLSGPGTAKPLSASANLIATRVASVG